MKLFILKSWLYTFFFSFYNILVRLYCLWKNSSDDVYKKTTICKIRNCCDLTIAYISLQIWWKTLYLTRAVKKYKLELLMPQCRLHTAATTLPGHQSTHAPSFYNIINFSYIFLFTTVYTQCTILFLNILRISYNSEK